MQKEAIVLGLVIFIPAILFTLNQFVEYMGWLDEQ